MTVEPRVAVVTGGSSGIGLATVACLIAEGWRVAFFSHQPDRVAEAEDSLRRRFPRSALLGDAVDLRDDGAVRGFFARVATAWGTADALVCNAGISPKGPDGTRLPVAEIDPAQWADVLDVNLTGALRCCRCALPGMAAKGAGRVVLIGSVAGRGVPRVAGGAYVASKAALAGLARAIVADYSRHGITANTVCPGRILSPMTGAADSPANRAALERIPIGRLGTPEDVARVVAFLLRPGSDFVNGAVLDVNGGELCAP